MSILDHKEDARIEKPGGSIIGPFKALFAGQIIIIDDPKADVEEGDTILRLLPNGKDDRSIVTEATFYNRGVDGIKAHYQIKYRKGVAQSMHKPSHNISITGAQSVQIGDYNTQNILSSFHALTQKIEASTATVAEKEEAKSRLKKLLEHPLVVAIVGAAAGSVL